MNNDTRIDNLLYINVIRIIEIYLNEMADIVKPPMATLIRSMLDDPVLVHTSTDHIVKLYRDYTNNYVKLLLWKEITVSITQSTIMHMFKTYWARNHLRTTLTHTPYSDMFVNPITTYMHSFYAGDDVVNMLEISPIGMWLLSIRNIGLSKREVPPVPPLDQPTHIGAILNADDNVEDFGDFGFLILTITSMALKNEDRMNYYAKWVGSGDKVIYHDVYDDIAMPINTVLDEYLNTEKTTVSAFYDFVEKVRIAKHTISAYSNDVPDEIAIETIGLCLRPEHTDYDYKSKLHNQTGDDLLPWVEGGRWIKK